jgi:cell division protein FtsB
MRKQNIRFFVRACCFTLSSAFFLSSILFSKYGVCEMMRVKQVIHALNLELEAAQGRVAALEAQLKAWNEDPYFKEKAAREDLLMGMEGETVYVLNDSNELR